MKQIKDIMNSIQTNCKYLEFCKEAYEAHVPQIRLIN